MEHKEYGRKAAQTFLVYGIAIFLGTVSLFATVWDTQWIPPVPLDGNHVTREAGEYFDLSLKSDIRRNKPCQSYIFYDTPIKTESTSVIGALKEYLRSTGRGNVQCGERNDCTPAAVKMCLGIRPPSHLIQNLSLNSSMVNCLRNTGFYHVTSIREPKARLMSVFKYNRITPGQHYNIDRNASFEEFLRKYPRCALFKHYDGLSPHCGSDKGVLEERAERIANQMDEIIEVTEKPGSDLHRRIGKYLGMVNVASLKESYAIDSGVPDEVVEGEYVLYNKLRNRRSQLTRKPGRRLCDFHVA